MNINEYFKTPIWSEQKPDFLKSLTKATDKYIKEARTRDKKIIKATKDFGWSHHSTPLTQDNNFLDFRNYVKKVGAFILPIYIGINMYQDFIF